MKRNAGSLVMVLIAVIVLACFVATALAAEVTVTGTINAKGKLVGDDGKMYILTSNAKGKELMAMKGKKFEVKATPKAKTKLEVIEYKEIR